MELDVAVATTFTLSLEAALVAPLAFASFAASGPGDPVAALEAVRSVADRLTVFCQAGEIAVPNSASDLYAFLEPVVHEVRRPRPGYLFHPKLWLLRYNDGSDQALRLLVPTRNLTNDSCWDTVLRLDGQVTRRRDSANYPLADLVDWCIGATTRELTEARLTAITSLTESVRRAEWDHPDGVNEMRFHAFGIGRSVIPDFSGRRTLVIAPFVNDAGLDLVAPTSDVVLISRPGEMEKLSSLTIDRVDTRWVASVDIDAPPDAPPPLGELHTKLVVVERGMQATMFVGSANATDAAYRGNVEVLVELVAGRKTLGIDTVLNDMGAIVEPCDITGDRQPSEADELQRLLDNILRDAAVAGLTVAVAGLEEHGWTLDLTSDKAILPPGFPGRGTVELMTRPGVARELTPGNRLQAGYESVELADITPFVVVRCEIEASTGPVSASAVVRARLLGDPNDRLDAVLARQVNTPEKFLRFLFLLLGLQGGGIPPWLAPSGSPSGASTDGTRQLVELGVFEAIMKALATNPAGLADLDRLVDRLRATEEGRARLPEGFEELWKAVGQARRVVAEASG